MMEFLFFFIFLFYYCRFKFAKKVCALAVLDLLNILTEIDYTPGPVLKT